MTNQTLIALIVAVVLIGCSSSQKKSANRPDSLDTPPSAPEENAPEQAPWQSESLEAEEVPAVYLEQWRQAENRASCALIAPSSLGAGSEAAVRSAQFGGGWGIAYDLPATRSAFGIAGTGVDASEPSYDEWPLRKEWPDGSSAGYGPEGGSGPNQLAYLRITGQECLYNVWSRIGVDHLEYLLEHLRFVRTGDDN